MVLWGITAILCVMAFRSSQLRTTLSLLLSRLGYSTKPLPAIPTLQPPKCPAQKYTTEIISLDPLLIYIHDFLSPQDIDGILTAGQHRFTPSEVYRNGQLVQNPYRTSSSAPLPENELTVTCVLERARRFMGSMYDPVGDEMGAPQLVRYTPGQFYNLHHDWMKVHQAALDGSPRVFNRPASFFVILEDECTDGETWFPFVQPVTPLGDEGAEDRLWRKQEDGGGLAFKPVAGNALFWVNLFPNGTGDERTVHAGVPVTGGLKTAMNIWPRKYWSSE